MKRLLRQLVNVTVVLVIALFVTNSYRAQEGSQGLKVVFFDIGQGDSILFDTPDGQQVLIDGGPNQAVVSELANYLPLSDRELDLVIITHNDADHLSGINEVLKRYQVKKIWLTGAIHTTKTYQTLLELIAKNKIPVETVKAGQAVTFGQLEGVALWPTTVTVGTLPADQNAVGIVTYWRYNQTSYLMSADIEKDVEAQLVASGTLRHADVLKIAHHGSDTSSTAPFLTAVTPKLAVISVGATNSYGHPSLAVLERLNDLKIPVLRTDQAGRITLTSDGQTITYKTER